MRVHLRTPERLVHGFAPPEAACPTGRSLYAGARGLTDELLERIYLQSNVLFPRFSG